jgi:hypothetical protein
MNDKLLAKINNDKLIMYRIPRGDASGDEKAERLKYDIFSSQG